MHELSIALSIMERAEEEMSRQRDARICSIHLRLGPLSGVVSEALLFSWEVACLGTALEGVPLCIREIPIRARCDNCAIEMDAVPVHYMHCRRCGRAGHLLSGDEMELEAIELEDLEHATSTLS